jgi:NAD+ synthase (glutamine-hydrolysing)
MSKSIVIALAQIDPVVGSFDGNVKKIRDAYERACASQARLLLTPELSICGYPPHDLVDRPEIFERNEKALAQLAEMTKGKSCALVVGHVARNPAPKGRSAQNVVSVLENGKEVFRQAKMLLPTYDVFDESRYFEPADKIGFWNCDGTKIALAICEDLWGRDPAFGRELYGRDPIEGFKAGNPELIISISASPYVRGKLQHREELHGQVAKTLGCPLIYVNQVGATDEVLFDGASFAVDSSGKVTGRLPIFSTSFGVVEVSGDTKGKTSSFSVTWKSPDKAEREDVAPKDIEILHRALVTGVREYFKRTGFKTAILGLSGGIDSAVVAVLAAEALGPKNVLCVAMPSQYSSFHSLADAELLATQLGTLFETRPIKFLYSQANREISERRGTLAEIAQENLQSRLRGLILMTLSNHYNALVLTTGNKSEIATGYCTLYGDMCGAIAPIGDLFKTSVYELARHMNESSQLKTGKTVIPESSITKPPSAELKPNQTDQDTLPPYEVLDALLEDYVEKGVPVADLEKKYESRFKSPVSKNWVRDILRRLEVNEYKRRQAAPVLKISPKAFGIGRRIPIAKFWDQ